MLKRLVVRDLVVLAFMAVCWRSDAGHRYDGTLAGVTIGVVTGLLTALVGYLVHEWGHLLGSLLSGSVVHYPRPGASALSFHFDSARNTRTQFYWMTFGGYVASLISVVAIWRLVPHDAWSGRVSIALAALGTLAIFGAEMPITVRVMRGAALPMGFAYRDPNPA